MRNLGHGIAAKIIIEFAVLVAARSFLWTEHLAIATARYIGAAGASVLLDRAVTPLMAQMRLLAASRKRQRSRSKAVGILSSAAVGMTRGRREVICPSGPRRLSQSERGER